MAIRIRITRMQCVAWAATLMFASAWLPSMHAKAQPPRSSILRSMAGQQAEFDRLFRTIQNGSVDERRQLAGNIRRVSKRFQLPLLQRLLKDKEPRVRVAAIETAREFTPTYELAETMQSLAQDDQNTLVRQYAQLLVSEWTAASPTGSGVQSRPDGTLEVKPDRDAARREHSAERHAIPSVVAGTQGRIELAGHANPMRVPPAPAGAELNSLVEDFEKSIAAFDRSASRVASDSGRRSLQTPKDSLPRPEVLRLPSDSAAMPSELTLADPDPMIEPSERLPPLGFTGPSGILPSESQASPHFVPVDDRWRLGFPDWNRLEDPDDPQDNYPYTKGHWWDPYNQNVLKGDYPIIGQHTFLNVTASSQMIHEYRQVPTATTPFESTVNPFQEEFFGNPDQYFYTHFLTLNVELFHGSTAFKPADWRIRVAPVLNFNYLDVEELAVVNPDVRDGTTRFRDYVALEQWFVEGKLADIGPDYDFLSFRAGSQPVVSDFRGFILADINRGVRLFGTLNQNREQFNLWWLDQTEKDTNSQLNSFDDRHQNTVVLNYFRQDTFVPGYTLQASFHYNNDQPSMEFDDNDFLVRPDPAGIFRQHEVEAFYYGIAGDGHFGPLNVSHAFYHVQGSDSRSPLGGEQSDINANMFAIELSIDRDWIRFRTSYFWASGDDDPNDGKSEGFDTILDNPNFAGGEFSYWNRQEIRLFGLGLSQRLSLVPNLRSSKIQGQSNFVNPGIQIVNMGMDFEVTPKTKAITNINWLWFDETAVLEQFAFQDNIDAKIGVDLSLGVEYRPLLNDNVQIIGGVSMLVPDRGFKDLYGVTNPFTRANADQTGVDNLYGGFVDVILTY